MGILSNFKTIKEEYEALIETKLEIEGFKHTLNDSINKVSEICAKMEIWNSEFYFSIYHLSF